MSFWGHNPAMVPAAACHGLHACVCVTVRLPSCVGLCQRLNLRRTVTTFVRTLSERWRRSADNDFQRLGLHWKGVLWAEGPQEGEGRELSRGQAGDLASRAGRQLSLRPRLLGRGGDPFWEGGSEGEGFASEARRCWVSSGDGQQPAKRGGGHSWVWGAERAPGEGGACRGGQFVPRGPTNSHPGAAAWEPSLEHWWGPCSPSCRGCGVGLSRAGEWPGLPADAAPAAQGAESWPGSAVRSGAQVSASW